MTTLCEAPVWLLTVAVCLAVLAAVGGYAYWEARTALRRARMVLHRFSTVQVQQKQDRKSWSLGEPKPPWEDDPREW
jgi:hypothetical protein